jgi:hypothetical protein
LADQGIWRRVLELVAEAAIIPDDLTVDTTHIEVHQSTSRGKRLINTGDQAIALAMTRGNYRPPHERLCTVSHTSHQLRP